jgi:UDP-glucose-4-epimerase GalE
MTEVKAILVTGGAGYIGSHVCWKLHEAGYSPVVIDNCSTGWENFVKFGPFIRGDISDAALVAKTIRDYKPVALMHLAAFININESVENPDLYFSNNTDKTIALFETVQDSDVHNIIYASTAAVYGIPLSKGPIHENSALAPINPYGESKLRSEGFLRSMPDVKSVALRFFNACGDAPTQIGIGEAHDPETHLIPCAILSALSGKTFHLFGSDYNTHDGTAIRDYVHVEDIADAHVTALHYLENEGASDVFNLGSGEGYSVREIIDSIARLTGLVVPVQIEPRRSGDPDCLVADSGKALQGLGWLPRRKLDEIIKSAFQWHSSPAYRNAIRHSGSK